MDAQPEIVELPARPYVAVPASVTMQTLAAVVPTLNQEVHSLPGAGRTQSRAT